MREVQKKGLGRDTSYKLAHILPKIKVGKRLLIPEWALDAFLREAALRGWDLRDLPPEAIQFAKNLGRGGAEV
ncbi:hypothetical protein YIM1627_02020 [Thermus oshimai]